MLTVAAVGKGGVGKSTTSAGLALCSAEMKRKTRLVDLDGGRSIPRMFNFGDSHNAAGKRRFGNHLMVQVIDPFEFVSIIDAKHDGWSFDEYMGQFSEDHGLVAFCDMITNFFGCPTDIETTQKFTSLVTLYHTWAKQDVEIVCLDMEPTAGLKRLLTGVDKVSRSLLNLAKPGFLGLKQQGIALTWPDVAKFLQSSYIKKAEEYIQRMRFCSSQIESARFLLVATPEWEPIQQMHDVKRVIAAFGGKLHGVVVNNCRQTLAERVIIESIDIRKPQVLIPHAAQMQEINADRMNVLADIGQRIESKLHVLSA